MDFFFLSEPNIFQADAIPVLYPLQAKYCYFLNSDDLHDPELPMVRSRMIGGTLILWAHWLDPYVTIHPPTTSAITALILCIPGYQVTVHVGLYLPTSGRDTDFVSEIANLCVCISDLAAQYPSAAIFIRGDSNVNNKNKTRLLQLKQMMETFCLLRVNIAHHTYHHFTGGGLFDSDIDVLLYSNQPGVDERVTSLHCIHDNPDMLSHHDIIISECTIPTVPTTFTDCNNLITAPRIPNTRNRVVWSPEGIARYEELTGPALRFLRKTWLNSSSSVSMSIALKMTNHVLTNIASTTNRTVSLSSQQKPLSIHTPRTIQLAAKKLRIQHLKWKKRPDCLLARGAYKTALKGYKKAVRTIRIKDAEKRDARLLTVLSDNPSSLYSFIKSSKKMTATKIEKLKVNDKVYLGEKVADGFYDAMTALKTCDMDELLDDEPIAEKLSTYEHIRKLSQDKKDLPPLSREQAASLLQRLKKNVKDFYSVTALHYIYAGEEGLAHFLALLNAVLDDVNNATIEELNTAMGLILYKGHKKDKFSERSYRTISTCPFLSKALDLYIRDLYQEGWDASQASTQYQGSGSSHELASLLLTEVIQHSLHVANQPVFLLALDAQSAFDRCLRQILVCELHKAGTKNDALTFIDNRLASRATVYEWNKELLGPAPDITGFEQGGINSSDYYKLYNNQQLQTAQLSGLGVDLGSVIISAIGQADDVILCSNDIDSLRLLVTLTERYCKKFRVKLVPAKTKLLGYSTPSRKHLLYLANVVNPVTIDGQPVVFTTEVEHVGVIRNTAGNIPHIMSRIAAHKSASNFVLSAGLARGHSGNPAASLRAHQLYASPKLFSSLATLVLSKSEVSTVDSHYQRTIMNLQRLHDRTPRCFVFLLAGCLPGEALLHKKQLTIFMQVCHLPCDPLNSHARNVLISARKSAGSWFQKVHSLCLLYKLPHPLILLDNPPSKTSFKLTVKHNITQHWENLLREEAASLPSLHYFLTDQCSLSRTHYLWVSAAGSGFECRKATILARMKSGRFRSEYLSRHWSSNTLGICQAGTCPGIAGTLEHLLIHCLALADVRERMWTMFYNTSVKFPALFSFLNRLKNSHSDTKMQFILDPLAIPEVVDVVHVLGQPVLQHIMYLGRTYAYYLYREKQILLGVWKSDRVESRKQDNGKNKKIIENAKNIYHSLFPGSAAVAVSNQPAGLPLPAVPVSVPVPAPGLPVLTTHHTLSQASGSQVCRVTDLQLPMASPEECAGGVLATTVSSTRICTSLSITNPATPGLGGHSASDVCSDQCSAGGLPCTRCCDGQHGGMGCSSGAL